MANATSSIQVIPVGYGQREIRAIVGTYPVFEGTMVAYSKDTTDGLVVVPGTTPNSGHAIAVVLFDAKPSNVVRLLTTQEYAFASEVGDDLINNQTTEIGQYVYMVDDHTVGKRSSGDDGPRQIAGIYMGDFGDQDFVRVLIKPTVCCPAESDTEPESTPPAPSP